MTRQPETTVYDAVGGMPALLALAHAWHERCLADPVAAHPFEQAGHPLHLERLAAYWGEALGGPATYTHEMGDETHARRLHSGNGEHPELDEIVIAAFAAAAADVVADPRARTSVVDYFTWANGPMNACHESPDDVADGLALPHWSWDGPVDAPAPSDQPIDTPG